MNITKIRLATSANFDLPMVGATPTDSYIVKDVEGLGPVDQELFIVNTQHQGGFVQNIRPVTREVVFSLGLNPNWAAGQRVEQLREALYGTILPRLGSQLRLQLMNGNTVIAEAVGHVKRCEPAVFSKEPGVQLVVVCPQPYFSAPTVTTIFPSLSTNTSFVFTNPGTAPSPFVMVIDYKANANRFDMTQQGDATMNLTIDRPFVSGDRLLIDTTYGARKADWSVPASQGDFGSMLRYVSPFSKWPQLQAGENRFIMDTSKFDWAPNIGFQYRARYLGV